MSIRRARGGHPRHGLTLRHRSPAFLLLFRSLFLSISLLSLSSLRTLGTHSYTPSLLYLCYHGLLYIFFPRVIAGCESILYPARLMATTTESLILRRLIRHDYAHIPPSRRYWISREDPSTNYLFNALKSRLLPYCDFHLDIEAVARPRFSRSLARSQVSRHFEPRDLDD